MGILKKYKKTGVVTIDDGNKTLDTPIFEVIAVFVDTINSTVRAEVLHTVLQGTVEQLHSATIEIDDKKVITAKKLDLDALEKEILKRPEYSGAIEQ